MFSIASFFYSTTRLLFGTLYPAYGSFKAIKHKDVREYARWMMYWVVFAIYSFLEVFADIFVGIWMPFYYEIKTIFVLWLMSPYGNGARIVYKNIVHPELNRREEVIDTYISTAKEMGFVSFWYFWKKGANIANRLICQLIHLAHLAMLHQLQRNPLLDPNEGRPAEGEPNLPNIATFGHTFLSGFFGQPPSSSTQSLLSVRSIENLSEIDAPVRYHSPSRWLSEGALYDGNNDTMSYQDVAPVAAKQRHKSDSNNAEQQWDPMEVESPETVAPSKSVASKAKVKQSRPKKAAKQPAAELRADNEDDNQVFEEEPAPRQRRPVRAAAQKARVRCRSDDEQEFY